jgi:hypothetical protein
MKNNFNDIIQTLIDTNEKLISGKIEVDRAKQICQNTQVLINAARLQFDVMKYLKLDSLDFFNNQLTDGNESGDKLIGEKEIDPRTGKLKRPEAYSDLP